jgi:RNA polymerase sigma-70 factor (ECF subfamily)
MSLKPSSDASQGEGLLVAAARSGDHVAFGRLVDRYKDRIYNLALGYVGDADDADDVAQEIFVKAYGALDSFRGQSQFYTWLYRIGMNACMDWVKSRSRRVDSLSRIRDGEVRAGAGSPLPLTDVALERRELRSLLHRALAQLPDEYRSAVVLREIEDLSYEEIAEALSCSIGTVKSRLFRARAQLKELLKNELGD